MGHEQTGSEAAFTGNAKAVKLFRRALGRWFAKAGRKLPWRETRDPYAILVSESMLQQTQVATVLPFYERWMRRFPDVRALAAAEEIDVLTIWQGLGYYARARNLHRAAQRIVELHGGDFPETVDEIRALPGVGRYTAGAIAAFAFNLPEPLVDANIARVLSRVMDLRIPVDSRAGEEALWRFAAALQPPKNGRLFNAALMELGALVCLPREPRCVECVIRHSCQTSTPAELPLKKPRRKAVRIDEQCEFITASGRVLLRQERGLRWRGLWKLPPVTGTASPANPALEFRYPFTHHVVALHVYRARRRRMADDEAWFPADAPPPMPAPHARALKALTLPRLTPRQRPPTLQRGRATGVNPADHSRRNDLISPARTQS
jgi:A/G-specific adenine glycosylase